jgi:hypothetical protein
VYSERRPKILLRTWAILRREGVSIYATSEDQGRRNFRKCVAPVQAQVREVGNSERTQEASALREAQRQAETEDARGKKEVPQASRAGTQDHGVICSPSSKEARDAGLFA